MDSSLSRENGVVKSRSLLGHFTVSASRPAVKKPISRGTLQAPGYASGGLTGFYNNNNNKITNRYE